MPSVINKNIGPSVGEDRWADMSWQQVWSFLGVLKSYLRLLGALEGVALAIALVAFVVMPRTYTAMAVIGPPSPSPTSAMMGSLGRMSPGGLTSSVFGGGGSGGRDPFQDFQQLLPSSRLSQVLMERYHMHQTLFAAQWDFQTNRWKPPGKFHSYINSLKGILHIDYADHPDIDTITLYVSQHLAVESANKNSASGSSIPLSRTSPYLNVYFTHSDPAGAEKLLGEILAATDQIVREDQRRDISARIAFLRVELSNQNVTNEERSALISVLSNQEQFLAILQADQRYASNLIVTPHAPLKPTGPPPIKRMITITSIAALLVWIGLVFVGQQYSGILRFIAWSHYSKNAIS